MAECSPATSSSARKMAETPTSATRAETAPNSWMSPSHSVERASPGSANLRRCVTAPPSAISAAQPPWAATCAMSAAYIIGAGCSRPATGGATQTERDTSELPIDRMNLALAGVPMLRVVLSTRYRSGTRSRKTRHQTTCIGISVARARATRSVSAGVWGLEGGQGSLHLGVAHAMNTHARAPRLHGGAGYPPPSRQSRWSAHEQARLLRTSSGANAPLHFGGGIVEPGSIRRGGCLRPAWDCPRLRRIRSLLRPLKARGRESGSHVFRGLPQRLSKKTLAAFC